MGIAPKLPASCGGNAGKAALRETAPRGVFGPVSPCIRADGVEASGDVFGPISPSCIREHGVKAPSLPGDLDDFLIELNNKLCFCIYRIILLLQMIPFQEYILKHLIACTEKMLTNSRESAWLIGPPEGP